MSEHDGWQSISDVFTAARAAETDELIAMQGAEIILFPQPPAQLAMMVYAENSEDWKGLANCAGEDTPRTWDYSESFFRDDVSSADVLTFPEPLLRRMATCRDCPVRRECLEAAYTQEVHWEGENTLRPFVEEDGTRYGIWGGIPGPIRERFASNPDRFEACEEWFQSVGEQRQWGLSEVVNALWEDKLHPSRTSEDTGT